ncbi:MAG: type IV toxin-antitoxin system AbiEi family antitoxin domain-containing protein [Micropruina sp.]|uniref:hypothetical protein n=1 Tax=Micropruina sp. TaxID=2737536 RepID=UPI0039E6E3BF
MSVRLTRDLNAEGIGSSAIRRLVHEEKLTRVRRGGFVTADETADHRQLIDATMPRLSSGHVLSHASAAWLHGLPTEAAALSVVTVTKPGRGGNSVGPYLHRYRTPLPDDDIETADGLERTTLARTVVDVGRCGDLGFAVAAADAALRRGLSRDQLTAHLQVSRRHGIKRARIMAELADPRSESPGESLSRVAIWRLGLPAPAVQFEIAIGGRTYRTDFAWPDLRVVGEFDGKVKYGALLRPGESADDVVMREKRREADLRAAGWWVVRWTYADVLKPALLERLLRPALFRAA